MNKKTLLMLAISGVLTGGVMQNTFAAMNESEGEGAMSPEAVQELCQSYAKEDGIPQAEMTDYMAGCVADYTPDQAPEGDAEASSDEQAVEAEGGEGTVEEASSDAGPSEEQPSEGQN